MMPFGISIRSLRFLPHFPYSWPDSAVHHRPLCGGVRNTQNTCSVFCGPFGSSWMYTISPISGRCPVCNALVPVALTKGAL